MFRFDCVLVDPTPEALADTLREAARSADSSGKGLLIRWNDATLPAFLVPHRAQPEGSAQLNATAPSPSSKAETRRGGRGHAREAQPSRNPPPQRRPNRVRRLSQRCSVVAAVWWSDWIGRKHIRIVGCQRQGTDAPEMLLQLDADHPAVTWVYPEHCARHGVGERTQTLLVCACGVVGSARELGWMGHSCGPCYDLREANAPQASKQRVLQDHGVAIASIGYDEDGTRLVWVTRNGLVQVYDLAGGRLGPSWTISGHGAFDACLSPEGGTLAWRSARNRLTLLDLDSEVQREIELEIPFEKFQYVPDGRLLAHTSSQVWDVETGQVLFECPGERSGHLEIRQILLDAEGTTLALGIHGDTPILWDLDRRIERMRYPAPAEGEAGEESPRLYFGGPLHAALLPGGRLVVLCECETWSGGMTRGILWDVASGQRWPLFDLWPRDLVAWAPGSGALVVGSRWKGSLQAWDVDTGKPLARVEDLPHARWSGPAMITGMAVSPDGHTLAVGNAAGAVKLWPMHLFEI